MLIHRLTILSLCGELCIYSGESVYQLAKLKPKFRLFKIEENEIKTDKIAAIIFGFVFLCSFFWFQNHSRTCSLLNIHHTAKRKT